MVARQQFQCTLVCRQVISRKMSVEGDVVLHVQDRVPAQGLVGDKTCPGIVCDKMRCTAQCRGHLSNEVSAYCPSYMGMCTTTSSVTRPPL